MFSLGRKPTGHGEMRKPRKKTKDKAGNNKNFQIFHFFSVLHFVIELGFPRGRLTGLPVPFFGA